MKTDAYGGIMEGNKSSEIEERKYLPLGSVVELDGGEQLFMILSRGVVLRLGDEKKIYDYTACTFPEGITGNRALYFNHDEIRKIVHIGYSDDEDRKMVAMVTKAAQQSGYEQADTREILQKLRMQNAGKAGEYNVRI